MTLGTDLFVEWNHNLLLHQPGFVNSDGYDNALTAVVLKDDNYSMTKRRAVHS